MDQSTSPNRQPDLLVQAIEHLDAVVAGVGAEHWANPSPCEGWAAEDVLGHVVGTLRKVQQVLDGAGPYGGLPSDPAVAGSAVPAWQEVRQRVTHTLAQLDLAEPGFPASQLDLPTTDLSVHAWDIAAATGQPRAVPDNLRELTRAMAERVGEERLRGSGYFGPAVTPAPGADETDRLMAWLGRSLPRDAA